MALPTTMAAPAPSPVLRAAAQTSRRVLVAALAGWALLASTPVPPEVREGVVLAGAALGLLIGLPHGSIDHVLTARLTSLSAPAAALGYGVIAVAAWVALQVLGPLAMGAVLALSLLHFALGEWEVTHAITGWTPPGPIAAAVALAGTGALLLPLARVGDPLRDVADAVQPGLGALLAEADVRVAVAAVWAAAAGIAAVAAVRARRWEVVADLAVIGAAGLLLPPLLAFGLWFGWWHGLRHLGRLLTLEPGSAAHLAAGDRRRAVRRLAAVAAWPTVAAAAAAAALVAVTLTSSDPREALGRGLVVLLALTVPHMVVVLGLDLQRWRGLRPR